MEAEKTIIEKWSELAHYLIERKSYNVMDKMQTLAKNENLLNQVRVSLRSIIITKMRHFEDLNMVVDICLQANNYSRLIKKCLICCFFW